MSLEIILRDYLVNILRRVVPRLKAFALKLIQRGLCSGAVGKSDLLTRQPMTTPRKLVRSSSIGGFDSPLIVSGV